MPNEATLRRPATAPSDWASSVDAIVRRAPASASHPHALRAQVRLLALLDSAAPLNVLLDGLATYVETWAEGLHCAVLLVDPSGRLLLPGAAPSLPAAYSEAIGPVPIGDGRGSCGTAAARREMVVVEDVEQSELWAGYAPIALSHGLRACWSMPIVDDAGALLGTLALYYRERRAPSAHEIDLIQFASFLAAFVIQRQREAEKRRTTDAWLETALWGADVGLWKSGDDGHCVWLDKWCERFDIGRGDGPNQDRPWREKIHPDDAERYARMCGDARRGVTEHYVVEYRIRNRSGRWTWLHERGRVTVRDAQGVAQSFVGVCFVIDEQKKMETALRESEQRFRSAFEFAAIGIALVGLDGRWLRVNHALSGIVGYTAEELLATTFQSITHPDDLGADLEYVREMLAGSRPYFEMEKRYFHKDGHVVWVFLSVSMVYDDAGQPLYFVSQIQDISARKQAESQLIDSEFRYRTIANLVPGYVFEGVVRDGRPHPTWVSSGFERVYGCSLERFMELGRKSFYDEPTYARILAAASTVTEGSDLNMEVPLTSTDGVQHWLRVVARGVRAEPGAGVNRVLGVAEDITERKRLEQALAAAVHGEQQRLGEAIRDELGQELMDVALLARGLAASARKGLQPKADELDRLSSLASRTISTCHGIAQGLAPLSESHGGLVQALHDMVDRHDESSGPTVQFYAIEDAPIRLQWPCTEQLFRIAQEGLANALKHAGARSIKVMIDVQPGTVRLEISDDGVGFSPLAVDSTGLGLKIMRYRAEMIDAYLSIGPGEDSGILLVCECRQPA
jgi:PAS domain S-box-containing protein